MRKVLVTGGHGQLGRTIRELQDECSGYEFAFFSSEELDITDENKVLEAFTREQPYICINTAAYTDVENSEREPEKAYAVNVKGVENVVKACKNTGASLIHISTDYVFDGQKSTPYLPSDATNPINVYGKSKLEGEKIIQSMIDQFFIVRTSWLYSKKYGKNFYRTILNKARTGSELIITDEQTGSPTNTESLCRYIFKLIQSGGSYGVCHFADAEVMTWFDFAFSILKEHQLENKITLRKGSFRTLAKRPEYSVLKATNRVS